MRLPTDVRARVLALGLTALLAACGRFGGDDAPRFASAANAAAERISTGPEADFPVVLGEPYTVNGTLYTPVDTLNYDEVGYAAADPSGGNGVTVAHRTLPMPSYVEITALETGKTILARVERRGPMTGNGVVGLSAGAKAQLAVTDNAPIRIRRVNPPEVDRAQLRTGQMAPLRMETPKSLLTVLKRKLANNTSVSLASANQQAAPKAASRPASPMTGATGTKELPPLAALPTPKAMPAAAKPPARVAANPANRRTATDFENAFTRERKAVTSYPLAPIAGTRAISKAAPAAVVRPAPETVRTSPEPATKIEKPTSGDFVIQAAAFSNKANADRLANTIDGFVEKSGRFYRVRKGPFVSRGQAEAALAKVRAAGYKDARVYKAG